MNNEVNADKVVFVNRRRYTLKFFNQPSLPANYKGDFYKEIEPHYKGN